MSKGLSSVSKRRQCAAGVCDPERQQGLKAPAPEGTHKLVSLKGPGVFVAAQVSKQGGSAGLTFVNLDIDGRNVVSASFAAAGNWGMTQANPYGLVLLKSGTVDTLAVGWPAPLRFERELVLSVKVAEPGIVQLLANVIRGGS